MESMGVEGGSSPPSPHVGFAPDVATGALGVVNSKLLKLLEYRLQKGVRAQVLFLSGKLMSMHAALLKVEAVPWDQLDVQTKVWAREAKEASYDMEDILDTFLDRVDGQEQADPNPSKVKQTMKMMEFFFSKAKARHNISNVIENMRKRVQEVTERHARYRVDLLPTATTSIDPRLWALYTKVSQLVGIEGPRDKVIEMLTEGEEMETKFVSIVGFGGLGKTTLAKAVYDKLTEDVQFKAFIPVGQNANLKKVLIDILIGLNEQRYKMEFNFTTFEEELLIDELREFLKDKRYFIVLDDLWDISICEHIAHIFKESNKGSRIIVTTRNLQVAKVGEVYRMKPLSGMDSKRLLCTRIFGGDDNFFDHDGLAKASDEILKRTGGVPLAIITVASLLATKPIEDWSNVYNSIGFGHEKGIQVDNMTRILSFSYYDLPAHLRSCLLYLSMYPQDHVTKKEKLIWSWIGEGFVNVQPEIGNFKAGESYFHELINRSMIQPVEIEGTDHVYGCQVHAMVFHFIRSLSHEQNFVSVLDEEGQISKSVRRLAIQNIKEEHILGNLVGLTKLRSLNVIGCPIYILPRTDSFRVLRVLDLENCGSMEGYNHKHLGELFHLRFLGLRNTPIRKLPDTIGHLQFLQTLELEGSGIEELPASMGHLRRLACLNADWTTRVNMWIEKLTSLQQLVLYPGGGDDQDSVGWFVNGLGNLRKLRVLRFLIKTLDEEQLTNLLKSLSDLPMMEVLHFDCYGLEFDRGVHSVLPSHLRELRLFMCSRLPVGWIKPQVLPNLRHLWLMVSGVDEQDLDALGGLPSLLYLHLLIENSERGYAITSGSGGFQMLKFCSITRPLKFVYGAMPRLEILDFHLNMRPLSDANPHFDFDFGLGNLNSLQRVIVQINYLAAFPEDVEKAEAALKDAIHIHPNRPSLEMSSFGQRMKTTESGQNNLTPKLEVVDNDGPEDKISNFVKEKEVEASSTKSNQTRELESIRMNVVTKAMQGLVTKLDKLLQEEYSLEDSMKKQAQSLSPGLRSMQHALSMVADFRSDQVDARLISWAREVKDASHGMECIIDNFLKPLVDRREPADPDRLEHFLEKMGSLLEAGKAFYYSKSSVHDGIDDPSDELIEMLSAVDHNEAYIKKMKILSIVRSEGLENTTLAQKVFEKLSSQFDCRAFVLVGQNPDLRRVFTDILIGVDKEKYKSYPLAVLDLTELIWLVRKSLINKRFFVVVDDIWDLKAWNIIMCALIENNNGSAVLTTTRRQNMKEYDDDKSRLDPKKLFYKRLFGSEDKCPPELKDICEDLIATCDGIRSVSIETLKLLASVPQTPKDWQAVCDRTKLALTYPGLPDYEKKCLLYFSMYGKGYEISGEGLVWAWIAEGFIQQNGQMTSQEVGESYLSDFVMRKMIEAVEVDASGKALSCRAYDLVHDFIISKSTEEKFAAILNDSEGRSLPDTVHHGLSIQGNTEVNLLPPTWLSNVKSLVVTCDTVPSVSGFPAALRAFLDGSVGKLPDRVDGSVGELPGSGIAPRPRGSISSAWGRMHLPGRRFYASAASKHALHVMDLGGCHFLQDDHLKGINNATSLKYLVIGGKYITGIPKDIAKLTHLQTLDLSASGLNDLPNCVFKLTNLVRLRVSSHMKIIDGIEKMSALQELGDVNITKPELLQKLCELVNLRVLRIAIWSWDESLRNSVKQICDNLCSLVRYRGNIQSLSIMTCSSLDFLDSLDDNWAPSLQMLEIKYSAFDALPTWFCSLSNISSLTIEVYELSMDMIVTLGNLPCLGSLSLTSIQLPKGYFVIDSERFKKLASLKFVSNVMKEMFGPSSALSPLNATQQLKRLTIVFQASRTEAINKKFSFGLENLFSPEHVRVEIICSNASHQMVNDAEAAIRKAIFRDRSSNSNLEIRRLEEGNMLGEEGLCDTQTQQEQKATKKWQNKKSSTKKIRVTGKIFRQKRRKELLEHIRPSLDSTTAKPHFLPSQSP